MQYNKNINNKERKFMKTTKQNNLTINEALILQQINDDGADSASDLAFQTGLSKYSVMKIVEKLRDQKLVSIKNGWASLTYKGRNLLQNIWPEAQFTV